MMGIDLLDFWRGDSLSLRRLLTLVKNLPESGRVVTELRRRELGEDAALDIDFYQRNRIIDTLSWIFYNQNIELWLKSDPKRRGNMPSPPEPYWDPKRDQPDEEEEKPRFASASEIASFITETQQLKEG